jgi:hypothetical protein
VVGAALDPIEVLTSDLIFGSWSIIGSLTGTPIENEDNLAFSAAHGVAAMNEVFPFADAPKAYERMMSGQARFRVVSTLQPPSSRRGGNLFTDGVSGMIEVSRTIPMNDGSEPALTADDVWAGLVEKAENPLPYVAAISECTVVDRFEGGLVATSCMSARSARS